MPVFSCVFSFVAAQVKYNCSSAPVITFGGSYGGMLASWFRIKYVLGCPKQLAHAQCSQVPQRCGGRDCGVGADSAVHGPGGPCCLHAHCHAHLHGQSNARSSLPLISSCSLLQTPNPLCSAGIRKSWGILEKLGLTQTGRDTIQKHMGLCKASRDSFSLRILTARLVHVVGLSFRCAAPDALRERHQCAVRLAEQCVPIHGLCSIGLGYQVIADLLALCLRRPWLTTRYVALFNRLLRRSIAIAMMPSGSPLQ